MYNDVHCFVGLDYNLEENSIRLSQLYQRVRDQASQKITDMKVCPILLVFPISFSYFLSFNL